jgi:DNA-binding NtrC family response regulator
MTIASVFQHLRKAADEYLDAGGSLRDFEDQARKAFLMEALALEGGNRSKTARLIGEHRNTLARHMQELNLREVFPDSRGSRPLPKPAKTGDKIW